MHYNYITDSPNALFQYPPFSRKSKFYHQCWLLNIDKRDNYQTLNNQTLPYEFWYSRHIQALAFSLSVKILSFQTYSYVFIWLEHWLSFAIAAKNDIRKKYQNQKQLMGRKSNSRNDSFSFNDKTRHFDNEVLGLPLLNVYNQNCNH